MTTPPVPGTVITSPFELTDLWRRLMGPGGFGRRSLWTIFLDEHDALEPVIMPIDDLSERPDPSDIAAVTSMITSVLDEQHLRSVAFLLSRPGGPAMTPDDSAWARALAGVGDPRFRRWPVHLATADRVRVFAPDDLLGAA